MPLTQNALVQVSFALEDDLAAGRLIGVDEFGAVDLVPVVELAGDVHADPAIRGGILQRRDDRSTRSRPDIGAFGIGIGDIDLCIAGLILHGLGQAGRGR
jgi:hypothetical protein